MSLCNQMKHLNLTILFLLIAAGVFSQTAEEQTGIDTIFESYKAKGCFVLYDSEKDHYIRYNYDLCEEPIVPENLYFIYLSIASLQYGVVKDINDIVEFTDDRMMTKRASIASAFSTGNIAFFEYLASQIKPRRLKKHMKKDGFGNYSVKKEDPFNFWDATLRISPNDVVSFLKKLEGNTLSFHETLTNPVKTILTRDDSLGYSILEITSPLLIKTKSSYRYNWYAGFVIRDGKKYYFATSVERGKQHKNVAERITKEILYSMEIIPRPTPVILKPKPTLDEMIGQMILVGVGGTKVDSTDGTIKAIKDKIVGGVILFEKNISKDNSRENLQKLTKDLQEAADTKLLICIDQEGGKVNRLKSKYGFPESVTSQYLGKIDNPDTTAFYAEITAKTLSDLNINLNFAPVVDLSVTDNFIKKAGRCFSDDPEKVTLHALRVIEKHNENDIITVIKHFPGHGSAEGDSHKGMVDVSNTWNEKEMVPYKKIIALNICPAVMTAHIINSKLEPDSIPATLSNKIINNILRHDIGFDGVVFSDDMQMKAISEQYGIEKAVALAINAGVDVLMYSHNIQGTTDQTADKVFITIKKLVDDGTISEERIRESYNRIIELKNRYNIIDNE